MATTEAGAESAFLYPDVQAVLDKAAGESSSDHGGLGRFWTLPLGAFLDARLMGLALIAPVGSCCGKSAPGSGRGARSALVQGLRGQAPFDGSRFVRLPWGGDAVDPADVDRIEAWIDEGCPDAPFAELTIAENVEVPADARIKVTGLAGPEFAPTSDPGAYRHQKGELRQRLDIDAMSEGQHERLRAAFREMYALNKWVGDVRNYNNLALIHQNHCQHGWERFLPWHRIYLYEFEQVLQDFCPDVTMPYWDFSAPAYSDDPPNGRIIPDSFKAYLDEASLEILARADIPTDPLRPIVGTRFTRPHDFFAAVEQAIGPDYILGENRNRFIDALLASNALWYPLRYPAQYFIDGKPVTINERIHYHYPSPTDIEEILSLRTFRDFGGGSLYVDSFGFLDQNPHNTMHIWTGGFNPDVPKTAGALDADTRNQAVRVTGRRFHKRADLYSQPPVGDMLSNLTASFDPIFWPIHANIDRLWSVWQQDHPNSLPVGLDAVLTPWSYAVRDTIDIHRFGYEYVRGSTIVPVGLDRPVGRFVSTSMPVPEPVRKGFRSAEVRLHRVPQLPRSCFIRVFLNVPDADGTTPLTHEGYAGYAAVFGHGECYGGPGHCDLPDAEPRKYDMRPRSMNTPRNHRIDVTRTVRRLLDAGASALTVTLVVIGGAYQEDKELLRLDGVSLNFLD
ncbi:tyrosinase family protein [Allosphingosinicella deserti]|uniref:Tyrosinase n=1 Tax=Allosphingosinicella deserti TaxID=2116704 RepID=A0A2P7QYD3_9SPHN|nr:tyrosinase family protein [Sphingomonas deserti]PSJ42982.1 tyrosinase [Sphingomonas deserti]